MATDYNSIFLVALNRGQNTDNIECTHQTAKIIISISQQLTVCNFF